MARRNPARKQHFPTPQAFYGQLNPMKLNSWTHLCNPLHFGTLIANGSGTGTKQDFRPTIRPIRPIHQSDPSKEPPHVVSSLRPAHLVLPCHLCHLAPHQFCQQVRSVSHFHERTSAQGASPMIQLYLQPVLHLLNSFIPSAASFVVISAFLSSYPDYLCDKAKSQPRQATSRAIERYGMKACTRPASMRPRSSRNY